MSAAGKRDVIHELDHMTPAAQHALLGTTIQALITQVNALTVGVATVINSPTTTANWAFAKSTVTLTSLQQDVVVT